jgi:DNA-binding IclR family transcriptional regulator
VNTPAVRTIDRLVEILDCFSHDQTALSLSDLSERLNLPKSTLHRFLVGLESHGVLRRDVDDRRWRLGYHLLIWGNLAAESSALWEIAKPIMRDLAAASGETTILTVYHDREVICIDMCETSHSVRLKMEVGARQAAHAGASSKVLLAYLPEEEILAIIAEKGLPKLCANTITDAEVLRAELACIRERGFAESCEETDLGAWGVAAPIKDWKGRVVGAIGLAGPTQRYSDEKVKQYVTLCRASAAQISAFLNVGAQIASG